MSLSPFPSKSAATAPAGPIEMEPGAAFLLHTHEGDHILSILSGRGYVHLDGVDHPARPGDTIFIPAAYSQGVKTDPACAGRFLFLAIGYLHRHPEATDRMTLVLSPTKDE